MGIDVILAEARDEGCGDVDKEQKLRSVIAGAALENTDEDAKVREAAIADLMQLLKRQKNAAALAELLTGSLRPVFTTMPKAKTARIVRAVLDGVAACSEAGDAQALEMQVKLCQETVEWCVEEKRTFLRQRVQGRLGALYLQQKKFSEALGVINELLREVKRLDDKAHLLEIQLTEAQIYHALRNLPKSRAALTSARTTANAIYVPPSLQAEIDMMAGIVSADEKDYKTAFSYFFEAFESLNSLNSPRTVVNLKYMLLCKIMSHHASDVASLVSGKMALKYPGPQVESMKAVAAAFENRSLSDFEAALEKYPDQLKDDLIVHSHLSDLYHSLLEENLLRLIEPYTCVEIAYIASLIALPLDTVESKLSQMILDKRLNGILDQGNGCLMVFDDEELNKTYDASLNVLRNMENVVDSLFSKASSLR